MKLIILLTLASAASVAALVCEDLSSCDGCVAKRFNENAPSCKAWGPKMCTRKNNKDEWEAKWCPAIIPGDPCEEFPGCDCVGEKAHGKRKCLNMPKGQGDEDHCDRKEANANNLWVTTSWCASTAPPTAQPTVTPPVTNPPTEDIVDCFMTPANAADYCGTCCPACTPVVDESSFKSLFVKTQITEWASSWDPSTGITSCVCLDFAESYYGEFSSGHIGLTPSSDCARITGGHNFIYGREGDDVMYSSGVGNSLHGEEGSDRLVMTGSSGHMNGDVGANDVCTDLGSNNWASHCDNPCTSSHCWP